MRLNKALDMGWRLEDNVLVPPDQDVEGDLEPFTIQVPTMLESWLRQREARTPVAQEAARLANYLRLNWAEYLALCEGDRDWAARILVLDASIDLGLQEDDVRETFGALVGLLC